MDGVDGQYLICILYRDFLLLATASRADQMYNVQACIGMSELKIEEVDNGRGMLLLVRGLFRTMWRFLSSLDLRELNP